MAYAGGYVIYSDDAGVSWTNQTTKNLWFEQYGEVATPTPKETYISGYLPRYQKRQMVGYHSESGDLRSIVVTASGHIKTDTVTVASGVVTQLYGYHPASGNWLPLAVNASGCIATVYAASGGIF